MIRGVLVDFDGTVLDNIGTAYETYLGVLRRYGLSPSLPLSSLNQFKKHYKGNFREFEKEIGLVSDTNKDRIWDEEYEKRRNEINLFKGAREFLLKIKDDNYKLGLVTSGFKERVERDLSQHKLRDIFGVVVTGEDASKKKPNPECLKVALEKLELNATHSLYAGDMKEDILAAKAIGIIDVAVTWGLHDIQTLREVNPSYVINTFNDFYNLVKVL